MSQKMERWGYDSEVSGWDRCICIVLRNLESGEEHVFGSFEELAEFMVARGGIYAAHYGGGFDHLLVMNHLPLATCIIQAGSKVLKATWRRKRCKTIVLRDTYPWWLSGLDKVAKALGRDKMIGADLPTKDGEFAPLDRRMMEVYEPSAVVEYCRDDVDLLQAGIEAACKVLEDLGADHRWTSGGCAVQILKALEPDSYSALRRHQLKVADIDWCADSRVVRGGRVEVFRYGKALGQVHAYDINSSYPKAYFEGPLPIGFARTGPPSMVAMRLTEWFRSTHRVPAPVLGWGHAGSGWCIAWLTEEEYQFLLTDPDVSDVTVTNQLYATGWVTLGKRFTETLYGRKKCGCFFSKVWLNSLHGKFSEKATQVEIVSEGGEYIAREKTPDKSQWHQHPLTAAWILARARIRLARALVALAARGAIYYCDTDCIHSNLTPEEVADLIPLGDDLGEWKLEASGPAYYIAPKVYYIDGKIRAKGISDAGEVLTEEDFAVMSSGGRVAKSHSGLTSFKTSLQYGGAQAHEQTRTIQIVATGKNILPDGRCDYKINGVKK